MDDASGRHADLALALRIAKRRRADLRRHRRKDPAPRADRADPRAQRRRPAVCGGVDPDAARQRLARPRAGRLQAGPPSPARTAEHAAGLADLAPRPAGGREGIRPDRQRHRPRILPQAAAVGDRAAGRRGRRRALDADRLGPDLQARHRAGCGLFLPPRADPGRGLRHAAQEPAPADSRQHRRHHSREIPAHRRGPAGGHRPSSDRGRGLRPCHQLLADRGQGADPGLGLSGGYRPSQARYRPPAGGGRPCPEAAARIAAADADRHAFCREQPVWRRACRVLRARTCADDERQRLADGVPVPLRPVHLQHLDRQDPPGRRYRPPLHPACRRGRQQVRLRRRLPHAGPRAPRSRRIAGG